MADKSTAMRKLLGLIAEEGNTEAVEEALKQLMHRAEKHDAKERNFAEQAKELQSALERLETRYEFQAGQLVQWKKGMKNRRRPSMAEPAIVVEVLKTPVFDPSPNDSSAATPYFREPLDILLGIIDDDGDFSVFHFDSRRFEPLKEVPPNVV